MVASDSPKIISRTEAKAKGLKRYYTGKPCEQGHVVHRFVSTNKCVECSIEPRRAFDRQYRLKHPDKTREWATRAKRKSRAKQRSDQVLLSIERGFQSASSRGVIMDEREAIDIFKAQDNAFDYIREME